MDNEKYLDIFIEESKDNLDEMENCSAAIADEKDTDDAVNRMFRAVHTLKGMAGTMGFMKMQKLFNSMEDLLSELKKRTPEKEDSDLLYEGTDLAADLLESVSGGTYSDIISEHETEVFDKFRSAVSGHKNILKTSEDRYTYDGSADIFKFDQKTAGYMITDEYNGASSYVVKVTLSEKCELRPARCFMVFREFEEKGKIYQTVPSEQEIMNDNMDGSFKVLFITDKKMSDIAAGIKNITDVESCEYKQIKIHDILNKNGSENESDGSISEHSEIKKTRSRIPMFRVSVENIDAFMKMVNELVVVKNAILTRYREVADIDPHVPNYSDNLEKLDSVAYNMNDMMNRIRMAPVSTVFERFRRTVRELSRELGKDLKLHISGGDTEIDRLILDELYEPLLHLIRNSSDHGIELPEERKRLGKTPEGNIYLNAYRTANSVFIEVLDDGHGIDTETVRQTAVKKGIFSEKEAAGKNASDLMSLIFLPGFSTSEKVTDVSGRGVGLDAVDTMVKNTGGFIKCRTELEHGTAFTIRYPLSMALVPVLRAVIDGSEYGVPVNNVVSIEEFSISEIEMYNKKFYFEKGSSRYRIAVLPDIYGSEPDDKLSSLIITNGREKAALIIDSLGQQQDVIVKSIDAGITHSREIGGAAIASDGHVILILDISEFFEM